MTPTTTTTNWQIDPLHSEIQFKVKHLVISTVTGTFKKFEGKAVTEGDDFTNARVSVSMDVMSIDTNQPQRDAHLHGSDFFSADLYPTITFESTAFEKTSGNDYRMRGNLTMRGVTKPIELKVEYGGSEKDRQGTVKHGFEVTGTVNRKEFGMTFNGVTETGGLALGEDIRLLANIQVGKLVAVPA